MQSASYKDFPVGFPSLGIEFGSRDISNLPSVDYIFLKRKFLRYVATR